MTDTYAVLGFVKRFLVVNKDEEYEYAYSQQTHWGKPRSKHVGVMLCQNQSEILIVTWNPKKTTIPKGGHRQKTLAQEWQTWPVSRAWDIDFNKRNLKHTGYASVIEYWSDKFALEGDKPGQFHLYQHEFKYFTNVLSNSKETVLSIRHARLWDDRGIIS